MFSSGERATGTTREADGEDQTLADDGFRSDNGTYFVDEIDDEVEYEFDLTDGNATLIVENGIDLDKNGQLGRVYRRPDRTQLLSIK